MPSRPFGTARITASSPTVGESIGEAAKPRAGHWTKNFRGTVKARRSGMNATERSYADHLDGLRAAGEILWWRFEPWTLRVTENAAEGDKRAVRLTPDFGVMLPDGTLQCHEVKGYAGETGMLRLKAAAEVFPFEFCLVTKRRKRDGGGFSVERL
jgi:hypothetical protein